MSENPPLFRFNEGEEYESEVTLRDLFAGMIAAGTRAAQPPAAGLSRRGRDATAGTHYYAAPERTARQAYEQADALLAEREKGA